MELSLRDLRELLLPGNVKEGSNHPYHIGQKYMIRTVTMIYTGILKEVYDKELVLGKCHWIAETERWNEFVSDCKTKEHESYGDRRVVIGRGSILDACIISKLPEGNK